MSNNQKMIDAVCEHRGLPGVVKGQRCTVDGRSGTIVGGNSSANLNVKYDDNGTVRNCHPYWRMQIFNSDGSLLYGGEGATP